MNDYVIIGNSIFENNTINTHYANGIESGNILSSVAVPLANIETAKQNSYDSKYTIPCSAVRTVATEGSALLGAAPPPPRENDPTHMLTPIGSSILPLLICMGIYVLIKKKIKK